MKTRILSQQHVRQLLTMDIAVSTIEQVFAAHGRSEAIMPSKVYLKLDKYHGDFRAMPAYLNGSAGVKWVNSHPDNPEKHGKPAVMALYVLSDPNTALPLAVMDATLITAYRTGAAGAVASQYLAKRGAKTLGLVGAGVQARNLLQAHRVVYPSLDVFVCDINTDAANAFAREFSGKVASLEEACGCDIVCTSTPSRTPVVKVDMVKPGTHINAMGADAEGKQELETALIVKASVFVDEFGQASKSGEINVPYASGLLKREAIKATLGEVVAGKKPGREGSEITIFDSTGLAIQDLAVARAVYDAANIRNIGQQIEFL